MTQTVNGRAPLNLDEVNQASRPMPPQLAHERSGLTSVAVVVPTYNEAGNVRPLVTALRHALASETTRSWEILFVDDSDDATPREVSLVAAEPGTRVRLLHRAAGERDGGLSGAVLAGLRATSADAIVVMDGDLQHPPGTVPALVSALVDSDLAVASRYIGGGSSDGLDGRIRHAISQGSTTIAKALFPRRLHGCSDPMTGFFALRRSSVQVDTLEPMGFKILLEILARHDLRVTEVPFTFGERLAGDSKASLRQGVTFAWQLLNLRLGRAGRFAVVGATGLVVNLVAMAALMGFGCGYVVASLLATEAAIVSNFLLQERLVFAAEATTAGRLSRAWQSLLFNNVEAVLRLPLLVLVVDELSVPELLAQALLILLAFSLRFVVMSRVVYRVAEPARVLGAANNASRGPIAQSSHPRAPHLRTETS